MNNHNLSKKQEILSYTAAFIFILLMVATAVHFADPEVILPEIAAMAVAIFAFREQSWMRQPEKIFILPSLTAIIGFSINFLEIPYGMKLVAVLILMLILMYSFKYSLPPALATGFLPIVSQAHSFSFIASILSTTAVLMVSVYIFRLNRGSERKSTIDSRTLLLYFGILVAWVGISTVLGYGQMAIIPPIAVVTYESLSMKMYSMKIALKQIAVLFLSASVGVFFFLTVSNWLIVSVADLFFMYLMLKLFKMHVPAVYAFPFLAFILPKEVISALPFAALGMSIFSFGIILIYRQYANKMISKISDLK
ncbi:hypothetical protein AB3466_14215 [Sphingobacterium thalpophilum]|uniref:HPP family protein n=1 Tax=Sphingobacterium thalpophilum TaxID=259 RepID=UPI0031CF981A